MKSDPRLSSQPEFVKRVKRERRIDYDEMKLDQRDEPKTYGGRLRAGFRLIRGNPDWSE